MITNQNPIPIKSETLSDIHFIDIFKLKDIQRLQDLFSASTSVASIITLPDGTPITKPSNFTRFCNDIIRKTEKGCANCFKSDASLGIQCSTGPVILPCLSGGLWDAGASITVGGKHIANWLVGQVRNEELDEQRILAYADEIKVDRVVFLEAYHEVPVMSALQFNKVAEMLFVFANELSEKAYTNLLLKNQLLEQEKNTSALKANESLLSSIYDTVGDLIFYLKVEVGECYRYISVNKAYCQITGLCKEMIVGRLESEILPESTCLRVFEKYRQSIQKKSIIRWEETFEFPSGLLVGEVSITPVFDENEICTHLVGSVHDITERMKAEEALKESEEKYRSIFENVQDVFYKTDFKGIILEISDTVKHFSEFNREELLGTHAGNLYGNPEDRAILLNEIEKNGELRDYELLLRLKNGVDKYVSINARLIFDANGKPIHINGAIRDITRRKLVEKALVESEIKYRELIENSPDAIAIYVEGKIVFTNNQCLRLLGVKSSAELIGKPVMQFVHPESSAVVIERMMKFVTGETSLPLVEEKFLRADGLSVDVEVKSMPIRFENKDGVQLIIRDVTQRKLAEQNLKNERLLLRAVIDNIPDLIYTKDLACRKTLVNVTELRYLGAKSEAEVIGMGDFDFYPKELAESFFADDQSVIKTGIPILNRVEYIFDQNQQKCWLSSSKLPLRDMDNKIIGMLGIGHDITERKKAEDELLDNNSKLAFVMKLAKMAWWKMDIITGLVTFDKQKAEMLGYSCKKFKQYKDFVDLVHPEDQELAMNAMQSHFSGQLDKYDVEYRILSKSGSYLWYHDIGSIIKWDSNGKPLIISGYVINITNQKQNEDVLRLTNQKLIEAQRVAQTGSWENDLIRNKLHWSEEMYHILGFSLKSAITYEKAVRIFPAEEIVRFRQAVDQAINRNVPYSMNYKIIRGDGSVRYIHDEGEVIRDEEGRAIRMFGTTHDITQHMLSEINLKEKNQQIEAQNEKYFQINKELLFKNEEKRKHAVELTLAMEKAEESDRLKSAFLANMSHEIRTPMNGILGFTSLLKEQDLTVEDQQNYLSIIEKSGARMLNIINDIVDISKIESGQMKISTSEIDVNMQVEYIYTFFKPETEQNDLEFSMKKFLPAEEVLIRTDQEKVYAILTNLVKNAIKYTPTGSIQLGYEKKGNFIEFFIKDTGIGITKEQKKVIFKRFRQGSESNNRKYEGAGLGLSISKAYVEMLGGKIWVDSEVGKGSVFYFTLPYMTSA